MDQVKLFIAIANGVMEKGEGGFLYVKDEMCAYCFPSDFSDNPEFQFGISELINNTENLYYICWEENTKRHVGCISKDKVNEAVIIYAKKRSESASKIANAFRRRAIN